jgi:hypothetical protein
LIGIALWWLNYPLLGLWVRVRLGRGDLIVIIPLFPFLLVVLFSMGGEIDHFWPPVLLPLLFGFVLVASVLGSDLFLVFPLVLFKELLVGRKFVLLL